MTGELSFPKKIRRGEMKLDKRYIQPCEIGGSIYGKKKQEEGHTQEVRLDNRVKTEMMDVYNKFYKNQLENLYKVINKGKK